MLELDAAIMATRSAIAAGFAEKHPQRSAHHVADRRSFGRRPCPDRVHQAGRQLERHRRRRLDNRHRSADQLGLLDVSVSLTARHCELARQRQGSLPHALPTREQPVSRIETFRLLRIGRPRHLSYEYYLLRRKSSTQRERSSAITRSKQKLPFAFGECSARSWRTCSCTMRSTRGCRETISTFRSRGTRTMPFVTARAPRRRGPYGVRCRIALRPASWCCIPRRRRSSTARMRTAGATFRTSRSTFSGLHSGRGKRWEGDVGPLRASCPPPVRRR